jgi:hypothetical protein
MNYLLSAGLWQAQLAPEWQPSPASEISMLYIEAGRIKLAIAAKRLRRKPIGPEASQFDDSTGAFNPGVHPRWRAEPSCSRDTTAAIG